LERVRVIPDISIRRMFENIHKICEWVEPILFRGFNQAEHDGAGFRAARSVREQEILAVNNKRLDAALSPVVADFQPPIQQIAFEVFRCDNA